MSVLVERSMGDLNKDKVAVYPLFQKGATPQPLPPKKKPSRDDLKTSIDAIPGDVPQKAPARRGRKPKVKNGDGDLQKPVNNEAPTVDQKGREHGELLEVDPNNSRRKRRKTTPNKQESESKDGDATPNDTTKIHNGASSADHILAHTNATQPLIGGSIVPQNISGQSTDGVELSISNNNLPPNQEGKIQSLNQDTRQPPRKVLRLNAKTGTIGSPPTKKPKPQSAAKGNRKTSATGGGPASKVVIFHYGAGQRLPLSIGARIDQILTGALIIPPREHMKPSNKATKRSPPRPAKSTHPFFLGKPSAKEPSPETSALRETAVIDLTESARKSPHPRTRPGSSGKPYSPAKITYKPTPTGAIAFSGFGASTKMTKFPGAVEVAWPFKDMVHIRGLSTDLEPLQEPRIASNQTSRSRKGKYQAVQVVETENILSSLAKDLGIKNLVDTIRDINPNEYLPLPDSLRAPQRHVESGFDLQTRVSKELRTRFPARKAIVESDDEIQSTSLPRSHVHPAIMNIYHKIPESRSAFDRGIGESLPWTQKYAPKATSDVLQTGRNASILKDWLQSLTVTAVEAGNTGKKSELAGKRKRKNKKLDGFVVSSDDETHELEEVSEDEDDSPTSPSQRRQQRTIVRDGDPTKDAGRVVVISGPHGCGKTATVYAVAKELNFEIFEINAGGRRNGKDIMDRVGDMTSNHQVQRVSSLAQVDGPVDEDDRKIDEALANDLMSGRQGTMMSFFKTNATTNPKVKMKPSDRALAPTPSVPATSLKQQTLGGRQSAPPRAIGKTQKQSLILIEEADLLYREDTQFWSTIQELIRISRRPIIITCNDELPIPLGSLPLHAIIRMKSTPIDLAVDYMLLVAACEGHVLKRNAIEVLHQNRGMDLRASLTDLNYWCQFGVGDQKNGLSWYQPRQPAGVSADHNGDHSRVVSEGTYEAGMGLLSRDILESQMHHLEIEEETLHEASDNWDLDMGEWQHSLDMESWAQNIRNQSKKKTLHLSALQAYEEFSEAMSGSELLSGNLFCTDKQLAIDATLPKLTTKTRDDYTLASRLLEASTTIPDTLLGKDISMWTKSRSRNYLHLEQHMKMDAEVPEQLSRPCEAEFIRMIERKATTVTSAVDRRDFSEAFDPISYPEKPSFTNSDRMEMSMFDRTTRLVAEEMSPYVRFIVDFDSQLQADREKLSNLISEGGQRKKRMRTTRAAMSALEGGARSTTRKEKYFGSLLNPYVVMGTGMQSWTHAAREHMSAASSESRGSSSGNSPEEADAASDRDD